MNFSKALTLILSATSSISAASQSSSSPPNNNLRGLSETIAYNAEDHDGLPESTYNALVSNRIETIAYWTPENIANAEYMGLHGVVNANNSGVGVEYDYNSTTIDYTTTNDEDVRRLQSRVADSGWTSGGDVLKAAGRLMFRMGGGNYVCSATAVTDNAITGRSLIITAGHCVYDQPNKRVRRVCLCLLFGVVYTSCVLIFYSSPPTPPTPTSLLSLEQTSYSYQIKMITDQTIPIGIATMIASMDVGHQPLQL